MANLWIPIFLSADSSVCSVLWVSHLFSWNRILEACAVICSKLFDRRSSNGICKPNDWQSLCSEFLTEQKRGPPKFKRVAITRTALWSRWLMDRRFIAMKSYLLNNYFRAASFLMFWGESDGCGYKVKRWRLKSFTSNLLNNSFQGPIDKSSLNPINQKIYSHIKQHRLRVTYINGLMNLFSFDVFRIASRLVSKTFLDLWSLQFIPFVKTCVGSFLVEQQPQVIRASRL